MESQIQEEVIRQRVYTSDLTFRRLVKKLQALTNLVDSVTAENNNNKHVVVKKSNNEPGEEENASPSPRLQSHQGQIESARDSLLIDLAIFDSGLVKLAAMHRVYQTESNNYIKMQDQFPYDKEKAEQLESNLEKLLTRSQKLQGYRQEYNEFIKQLTTGITTATTTGSTRNPHSRQHSVLSSSSSSHVDETPPSSISALPHSVSELNRMIQVLEKENTHLERESALLHDSIELRKKWADQIAKSLDQVKHQIDADNEERNRLQASQDQDEDDNDQQNQQQQQTDTPITGSHQTSQTTTPPPETPFDQHRETKDNDNDIDSEMQDANV